MILTRLVCHTLLYHLFTGHLHLQTIHLLFLSHQTRTVTSGSLIHQHHHPGMMPSFLHCSSTLYQCILHPLHQSSLHPEPSGPPKGKPIPVIISNGIPPEQLSDTDLDEELQHPDLPIAQDEKRGRVHR